MKFSCRADLYFLGELVSPVPKEGYELIFKAGNEYEVIGHLTTRKDRAVDLYVVSDKGINCRFFLSDYSSDETFLLLSAFDFKKARELENGHRLNITLDAESFKKLERIKEWHNDPSYTHSIKRLIALLAFFDKEMEKGKEFFIGMYGDAVARIIFP
jgi:hypothetical protein